jgi:copper(I)-binding protein
MAVLPALFLSLVAAAQQPPSITLAQAWVRALPPTQSNTAAYVTVTNPGKAAIVITGASTELAQQVQIHTTREIEGYMRMEQLQQLPVAAGESVQLAPGGTHLMLLGLARMPAPGETVHLCLELATGEEVCTDAPVRKSSAGQKSHAEHQHH